MGLPNYGNRRKTMPVLDHRASAIAWDHAREAANVSEPAFTREPSIAERARTTLGNSRTVVLTVTVEGVDAPLGFVIPFALNGQGIPVLSLREGVEQASGAGTGSNVSLVASETALTANHSGVIGGVCVTGALKEITNSEELEDLIRGYARMQPTEAAAAKKRRVKMFCLIPNSIRIGLGSGDIVDVNMDEYRSATSDPLGAVAPGLVSHLTGEQGGSLVLLCRAYGGQPSASAAQLAGVDQYGLDLIAVTPQGRQSVRISFPQSVSSPEDVRRELDSMARGARFKLGVG
jgi:hypothetical protein